jgi:DNA-binding CsgD family transcriptional regulator
MNAPLLKRYLPILLITAISILSFVDIVREYRSGESLSHLVFELIIAVIAISWFFYLLLNWRSAREELLIVRGDLAIKDEESRKWKEEYAKLTKGLSNSIDNQFSIWGLTPAEKDVGLLLLKGLSFKEISDLRNTSEKTTRQQATNIYQKAGLPGRAELSAWFLDDFLMGPTA